jgi:hypothetical protein
VKEAFYYPDKQILVNWLLPESKKIKAEEIL